MTRSLVTAALLGTLGIMLGTTDAEASRCCKVRTRCVRTAYVAPSCCGTGVSGGYQSHAASFSTYSPAAYVTAPSAPQWASPAPVPHSYSGYAAPTNVETRPKTSETAPAAGPAPAGETPAEEAPRPN